MRHLILILMIALLPLRSWAGDVMSIAMNAAASVTAEAMPSDCPMRQASAAAAETVDLPVESSSPAGALCDVCDLCLPFTDLVAPVFTPGGDGTPRLHSVDVTGRNMRPLSIEGAASDPDWGPLLP